MRMSMRAFWTCAMYAKFLASSLSGHHTIVEKLNIACVCQNFLGIPLIGSKQNDQSRLSRACHKNSSASPSPGQYTKQTVATLSHKFLNNPRVPSAKELAALVISSLIGVQCVVHQSTRRGKQIWANISVR